MANNAAEEDVYDLASDPPPRPVIPVAEVAPAKAIGYRTAPLNTAAEPEVVRNLYMPLWLLGGGVAVEVIAVLLRRPDARAVFAIGANVIVGTALMMGGILIAARLRGIDLGRFWNAAFKLAAISIAPAAAVTLITPMLRFVPLGGLLGFAVQFVLYFALLGALFDLDQSDTWYCILVIFLVQVTFYFAMLGLGLSL